jgi:CO/xanthine dehydrogenase FAD-binding subunit
MRDLKEYHRPQSLPEALDLLNRGSIRTIPLAGGTALGTNPSPEIEAVVDLSALSLDYIHAGQPGLAIGAMTRLSTVCVSPECARYSHGVLCEAVRRSATSLQMNQATFGGTLLSPLAAGELAAVLLVWNCSAAVGKAGETSILELGDLYKNRSAELQGALLLEARIPALPPGARTGWSRVARSPRSQPILAVASYFQETGPEPAEYRFAVSGRGRMPARMTDLEAALAGKPFDPGSVQLMAEKFVGSLNFEQDGQGDVEYRQAMLPILVRRALKSEICNPQSAIL